MTTSRSELIAELARTPSRLDSLTAELKDEALDFRPEPDDWSIREILAHLVDDEMFVMRTRLERIIKENKPLLAPHDEKYWYANRNTSRDRLADLLADFQLQRSASLGIMNLLRNDDWLRQGFQPEYGQFSAEEWLDNWAGHDRVHLLQIETNLRKFEINTGLPEA